QSRVVQQRVTRFQYLERLIQMLENIGKYDHIKLLLRILYAFGAAAFESHSMSLEMPFRESDAWFMKINPQNFVFLFAEESGYCVTTSASDIKNPQSSTIFTKCCTS